MRISDWSSDVCSSDLIDAKRLVDAGSRRQKWIDQAQSLNLYMAQPSGKKLDELYKHAWLSGLKTTYYLRTMGATHAEKTTIEDKRPNAVGNAGAGTRAAAKKAPPAAAKSSSAAPLLPPTPAARTAPPTAPPT